MSDTNACGKELVFWDCGAGYKFSHTSVSDAVAEFLNSHDREDWPEYLDVYGYAPMKKPDPNTVERAGKGPLAPFLATLDDWLGDSDSKPTTPSYALRSKERQFIAAVLDEYKVTGYEHVDTRVVKISEWVAEFGHKLDTDSVESVSNKNGRGYDLELVTLQVGNFDRNSVKLLLDVEGEETREFFRNLLLNLEGQCDDCRCNGSKGSKKTVEACEGCGVLRFRRTISSLLEGWLEGRKERINDWFWQANSSSS